MDLHDVLIAGAGPSGGIAAYELARLGYSVVILERERLPRYKPCGGGVTRKALRLLPFDLNTASERAINSATLLFRDSTLEVEGTDIGLMFMRPAFDHAIVQHAVARGARLVERARVMSVTHADQSVEVETTAGPFRGRVLIGSDGTESVVARSIPHAGALGTGLAIEAETEPFQADCQRVIFDFAAIARGYGYVFPKASHLSIGLYTTDPSPVKLRSKLDAYLASGRIPRAGGIVSVMGHRVPNGRLRRRIQYRRTLLTGDAAGAADPLWGEGIYYALRSGLTAAAICAEALRSGTHALSRYQEAIESAVGRDLRWARLLAAVLYRLPEWALIRLAGDAGSLGTMVEVLRGDARYRDYVLKAASRLPALALRGRRAPV